MPTRNESASAGGWRLAYASTAKIAIPPRISAQATGGDGLRQFEAHLLRREAADHRDRHREGKLVKVAAVLWAREMHDEVPEALAVDDHDREDRTGLDVDVEQIGAPAEPVLHDQQVSRARYRQKLRYALDDAEQDDLQQTFQVPPAARTRGELRIVGVRNRLAQATANVALTGTKNPTSRQGPVRAHRRPATQPATPAGPADPCRPRRRTRWTIPDEARFLRA